MEEDTWRNFYAWIFFIDYVVKSIREYIPKYQRHIKKMKQDGFSVIGYCRKSCTNDDNGTRVRLLQTMVDRLQEKSLVDRVFVSPFSSADEEINSRDTQDNFAMNQLENVSGNTQGK